MLRNIFCNSFNCTETTIPMYLWPSVLMGVGLSDHRVDGLSGCRTIGLSGRRTIGLSDYRAVGILGLNPKLYWIFVPWLDSNYFGNYDGFFTPFVVLFIWIFTSSWGIISLYHTENTWIKTHNFYHLSHLIIIIERVSESKWDWLFNVTCNDVSVIYATAHTCRCAGGLKKFDLRSGSQRHRHFVGFFNVPVQAPTRGQPFIRLFRESTPFSRLLRHAGDTGHILKLTPGSSWGYSHWTKNILHLKNKNQNHGGILIEQKISYNKKKNNEKCLEYNHATKTVNAKVLNAKAPLGRHSRPPPPARLNIFRTDSVRKLHPDNCLDEATAHYSYLIFLASQAKLPCLTSEARTFAFIVNCLISVINLSNMNYLPTCTPRFVEQRPCQISFKSTQGCRRSWEDKLKCVKILNAKDHNSAKICRT